MACLVYQAKSNKSTSGDDLWVAYWLGMKAGLAAEDLLKSKTDQDTWRKVTAAHRIATQGLGPAFNEALQKDAPASRLSQLAVDDLFRSYRLLSDEELTDLRQAGASNQEVILAALVAAKTGGSARQVCQAVKSGGKTWGAFLQQAKIDAGNMHQELVAALKLPAK